MKKLLAIVMAVVMAFMLSACGNVKDVTKMASVGDESVGKGIFRFYLEQGKSMAMQMAMQNGDTLSYESSADDWNNVKIEEKSAADYAIDYAKDAIKSQLVLKAKAVAEGIVLTDEDKANISAEKDAFINQYGKYNYEQYLSSVGCSMEDIEQIIEDNIYGQKIIEKYFGDGETEGEIKVSEEDVKKAYETEYVKAKHILISNAPAQEEAPAQDAAEEEATDGEEPAEEAPAEEVSAEELDKEAKAKAEEIIKKLEEGADFDTLMKENTADVNPETGEINGVDGYVFTKGEMVKEFEEEAFNLEVNAMSKAPVATDYGYHIIWKLPLPTEGEEYESALSAVKNKLLQDMNEEKIDQWAAELGFKFNDKAIENVKIG